MTSAHTAFAEALAKVFVREGLRVLTPESFGVCAPESVDIYVDTSDSTDGRDVFTEGAGLDESLTRRIYEHNVLRPMTLLEAHLKALIGGQGRRLCFLSSRAALTSSALADSNWAYKLSKAALHMFLQMAANKLLPMGFTFRLFDPLCGLLAPEAAAEAAFSYFTRRRGTERDNPMRDDETRLVLRDALGGEHAW
jgi:NAD(P)-dependent dehydrogenase (short-subunit alcohol dehydrogenase family)